MKISSTNLRFKRVLRLDTIQRHYRLFRVMWERGRPGFGGYSAKFSVALTPRLLLFTRQPNGWLVTVLGVRLHYARSYGGRFA